MFLKLFLKLMFYGYISLMEVNFRHNKKYLASNFILFKHLMNFITQHEYESYCVELLELPLNSNTTLIHNIESPLM